MESRADVSSDTAAPADHAPAHDAPAAETAAAEAAARDAAPAEATPARGPAPGGVRSFRELFQDEFGGMIALARLLGSDDPENTVQEAFLRLHDRWDRLQDPAAAIGYLRTTVVRLTRNRLRHLAVVRRHASAASAHAPAESAETDALQQEEIRAVRAALDRLPTRRRAALVLRYYADLPYQDIATTLRCPAATARSHVRRGLSELERLLGDRREIDDGGDVR